jgi:hypothetical protein
VPDYIVSPAKPALAKKIDPVYFFQCRCTLGCPKELSGPNSLLATRSSFEPNYNYIKEFQSNGSFPLVRPLMIPDLFEEWASSITAKKCQRTFSNGQ